MNSRATVLAALLVAGPVQSASAAPAAPPPPYQGVYQPQGADEIGMWQEDDESERALAASNLVIRDEQLTAYVKKVLCDTVGTDRCNSVRVYIVRNPTFNASMSPNGTMRVWSGLFLRIHNEAELGAVLGHEFGHFEKRHSVNSFKAQRGASDILAWSTVLAGISASYGVRQSYQNLDLTIYGNLYRYGRNQEREADLLGIAYLNRSALPPQGATLVWQNIMAETDASARAKGLSKPDFKAIAFTASHPPHAERAAYLADLAQPDAASRDDGTTRYRQALAGWMPTFLDDQIKLNDFGATEYLIQALGEAGWTGWLWNARGELYRTRGNPRDLVNAIEFYTHAIEQDPTLAEAHRGLGLSLIKTGHTAEGQVELRKYLELKPAAPDAKLISMMLPKQETPQ